MNKITEKILEIGSFNTSGNFTIEIQSGAFRFYPQNDEAKKAIWKIKKQYNIDTRCESYEEVWSLYFHPLDGNIMKVSIQK